MKVYTNLLFIGVVVALGGVIAFLSVSNANKATNDVNIVKAVCERSRELLNGSYEEACGAVQDATNLEFKCESYEADAKCTVEKVKPTAATYPTASGENLTTEHIATAINVERDKVKAPKLSQSAKLSESACLKLDNMVAEDYWAHNSPAGVEPWYWFKLVGYDYKYAGENLAYGQTTTSELISQWINSPKHKETMLNPDYKEYGICTKVVFFQGKETTLTVNHFGAK